VRRRLLLPILLFALLLAACGDDDGQATDPSSLTTPTTGTGVVGPTEGQVACTELAQRYLDTARRLFDRDGTPSDALVERIRTRLEELDGIAAAAGCGPEYVTTICEGFDAMAAEGVLVILPLTTAQCG
jgi:hypothetical protein